jgi:hypothetical protein
MGASLEQSDEHRRSRQGTAALKDKRRQLYFKGTADLDGKLRAIQVTGHFPALRFLSSPIWLQGKGTSCNLLTNAKWNGDDAQGEGRGIIAFFPLFLLLKRKFLWRWEIEFWVNRQAGVAQWYSAGLRTGQSGVRVPAGVGNFSLHHRVQTQPHILWVTRALSLWVKQPGREADH